MFNINKLNIFLYFLLSTSIMLGLYFGEDSAGSGGFIIDFNYTWPLVVDPYNFSTKLEIKFPLHYYIAHIIYLFSDSKDILRMVYCCIAITTPYLFFICLKNKFKELDHNNLFFFSLIIFLLPSFRSAAIWPNTQITALIFFLISIIFFLKWENKKDYTKLNINLILTVFFLSLTVYTRQLYAMIFFYIVIIYFKRLSIKNFISVCSIILLMALPGIIFVIKWPKILAATFDNSFYNSLLVNPSIISLYLIPFYFFLLVGKKIKIQSLINNKKDFIVILIFLIIVGSLSILFNYNYNMGGGFFIKLSLIFFNNLYLFYFTSLVGLYLLYIISKENIYNALLVFILLISFSAFIIFQKYFEPMFIILMFTLLKIDLTKVFLQNKKLILYYHLFFLFYLSSAIYNNIFLISKNLA